MLRLLTVSALAVLPLTAAAQDQEMCFDTAVTQMLAVPDGVIGAEACESACQDSDTCIAWNYKPHSFEPKTMAGDCRLMPDIYETTDSDKYFCGRIER